VCRDHKTASSDRFFLVCKKLEAKIADAALNFSYMLCAHVDSYFVYSLFASLPRRVPQIPLRESTALYFLTCKARTGFAVSGSQVLFPKQERNTDRSLTTEKLLLLTSYKGLRLLTTKRSPSPKP
jgi:hypothetical protein